MELIPAIDLRHGAVVRLEQGDDGRRKSYGLDPQQVLAEYAAAGVGRVHVVDLDAAFDEAPQRPLIADLASGPTAIELGGGLRDEEAVAWALEEAGCERVVLGSLVAREFDRFAALVERFPGRLVPAVEVADGKLKIAGWREEATMALTDLTDRLRGLPCPAVLVTDVERDGTLEGPNLPLVLEVAQQAELPVLLSGGVSSLADLSAASRHGEVAGAIVGKALYEGVFDLEAALKACRGEAP